MTAPKVTKRSGIGGRGEGWPHWTTPTEWIARVRKSHRSGVIALDPCSNIHARTGAIVELVGPLGLMSAELVAKARHPHNDHDRDLRIADGLTEGWSTIRWISGPRPIGVVYVNPPYGRATGAWLEKCHAEMLGLIRLGCSIVTLHQPRTSTAYMHDHVFGAAMAGCFVRGRIAFDNPPPGSDGDASSVESFFGYYGDDVERFLDAFDGAGELMRLNLKRRARR